MEIGAIIHSFPSCSSTNDLARDLAAKGEPEGAAVLCAEQTAGRGTKGRAWYSAAGKGLYVSIILRPQSHELALIPLLAGVAVADAVEAAFGVRPGLKWPNDLVWQGKKLGGILSESSLTGERVNFVVLGIGLNINHAAGDFPPEIQELAVSLRMIAGRKVSADLLLPRLWQALGRWYARFGRGDGRQIIETFGRYSSVPTGTTIVVRTANSDLRGVYAGLDERGGLVLEVEGRKVSFYAAEIIALVPK
jgi:BirA family biotin operon repressor/biotin-[acetyl-CoA-carboxylase] ligase